VQIRRKGRERMTHQQKRLRREYTEDNGVPFSEKTCDNKKIKLEYYGTIQELYDNEYNYDKDREDY